MTGLLVSATCAVKRQLEGRAGAYGAALLRIRLGGHRGGQSLMRARMQGQGDLGRAAGKGMRKLPLCEHIFWDGGCPLAPDLSTWPASSIIVLVRRLSRTLTITPAPHTPRRHPCQRLRWLSPQDSGRRSSPTRGFSCATSVRSSRSNPTQLASHNTAYKIKRHLRAGGLHPRELPVALRSQLQPTQLRPGLSGEDHRRGVL